MQRPDWVDDDLYPFADRWLELDGGACVHYVDEGTGPPILMLHGNPTWSFLYRDVIRALRGEFRCIALDLPGHGLTVAPEGTDYGPEGHADLVEAFIAELDLDGYILMGHDWGGPIGLAAAGRDPARVAGLVLMNTWAWSLNKRPPAHLWAWALGGIPGRYLLERIPGFVTVGMWLGAMRRRPTGAALEHYQRPFSSVSSRRPLWRLAEAVTGSSDFLEHDAGGGLEALRDRPTLLAWGNRDPILGFDRGGFEKRVPNAEVHVLDGAGHFVQEDAPEEIAEAVRSWWAAQGAAIAA